VSGRVGSAAKNGCPILRAFCEGWVTTNLNTNRRVSDPVQRTSPDHWLYGPKAVGVQGL
jgi:hypothetical protein